MSIENETSNNLLLIPGGKKEVLEETAAKLKDKFKTKLNELVEVLNEAAKDGLYAEFGVAKDLNNHWHVSQCRIVKEF